MLCNGYTISGNLAHVGRRYEVHDAAGEVVHEADSKRSAVDWCEDASPGDVSPLDNEPPTEDEFVVADDNDDEVVASADETVVGYGWDRVKTDHDQP